MGIRGLRSFISRHPRHHAFMKKLDSYLSEDCVLIIEAPNMLHKFYEHLGLDSTCGGQYEGFYQGVVEFFSTLRGEYPRLRVILLTVEVIEEVKLDVIKERKLYKLKEWVSGIERAESISLIPGSADEVLFEAVRFCGVETLCYDGEADDFISALALYYIEQGKAAFVLSEDTDFYVTEGLTGVLSMEDIVWNPSSRSKPILKESRFFSLPCFLREVSCQIWMIPFVAVIQGNDITPQTLKIALEPVKAQFSSQGKGHFFNKLIFYLAHYTGNELATVALIKSKLTIVMQGLFDSTYAFNKNRYLAPIRNIDPRDIPTPQLLRIKAYYPGVASLSLIRIGFFWTNRMRLYNNSFSNSEDYNQPPATLASRALRAYWHAVIMLTTDGQTPANQVTEIIRKESGKLIGAASSECNIIVEDKFPVLYECGNSPLPNLLQLQEMPRGDKINIFRSIMHTSGCQVIFSETEFINYEVSVILSTLYYWFHQISFRELNTPSLSTPLSPIGRQTLLRALLASSLGVYYRDRALLPALKNPDIKKATRHEHFHSCAEWCKIQKDANNVLTVLDLPTVSARFSYDGYFLLSMVTDDGYCNAVEMAVRSFLKDEFHNIYQSLLSPCFEIK